MSIFYIFIQWDRSREILRANKTPSLKAEEKAGQKNCTAVILMAEAQG